MSEDGPDDLVLRYLRRLDEKVDRLGDDVREVKQRFGALVEGQASLLRRLDRQDLDRIRCRLDLADA